MLFGFRWYPAAWLGGLNAVVAAVVAFDFMTQAQAAYVTTIATAVIGLVSWWLVRPLVMPVFASLLTTILVAIGGFGLRLADDKISALVVIATLIASGILHLAGTPTAGSPAKADPQLAVLAQGKRAA